MGRRRVSATVHRSLHIVLNPSYNRVYQMSLLEAESTGEGTPQGVVLALAGGEGGSPKDQESVRSIRMYNLASLINLAKWATVQQVCCIEQCYQASRLTPISAGYPASEDGQCRRQVHNEW
jgi:hypothetical protein